MKDSMFLTGNYSLESYVNIVMTSILPENTSNTFLLISFTTNIIWAWTDIDVNCNLTKLMLLSQFFSIFL